MRKKGKSVSDHKLCLQKFQCGIKRTEQETKRKKEEIRKKGGRKKEERREKIRKKERV